ncbi:MAG: hypothetical protein HOV94_35730, partial [Saccharothrix sp.]|nr:hypothetical protein [Saccharothrix sp.]
PALGLPPQGAPAPDQQYASADYQVGAYGYEQSPYAPGGYDPSGYPQQDAPVPGVQDVQGVQGGYGQPAYDPAQGYDPAAYPPQQGYDPSAYGTPYPAAPAEGDATQVWQPGPDDPWPPQPPQPPYPPQPPQTGGNR